MKNVFPFWWLSIFFSADAPPKQPRTHSPSAMLRAYRTPRSCTRAPCITIKLRDFMRKFRILCLGGDREMKWQRYTSPEDWCGNLVTVGANIYADKNNPDWIYVEDYHGISIFSPEDNSPWNYRSGEPPLGCSPLFIELLGLHCTFTILSNLKCRWLHWRRYLHSSLRQTRSHLLSKWHSAHHTIFWTLLRLRWLSLS